ncbi:MAG: ABC transporter permease [Deltaproteobacteria bacterium]|nr:ABC transporter permease [Deltaproteobacteria bacterium]
MVGSTSVLSLSQKSQIKQIAWHGLFGGIGALLLLAAVSLVVVNALFLGWSDFWHYLGRPRTWSSLWITIWTAALATAISLAIGIPAGYALSRRRVPLSGLAHTLIDLPVMVPPAAVGIFLLGVFKSFPAAELSTWLGLQVHHAVPGVVVAQVAVTLAFGIRLIKASFDAVSPRYEAVSRSLGASLPRTFFSVSLPLARNGILASVIVIWARAAAEWEALMLFVGGIQGRTDTLPFAVYLDWNGGILGWSLTNSLFCVVIALGSMYAVRRLGGRGHVY